MFRSSTIIREPALNLAKVIFMLKHSIKLRRYLLCGCVAACHGMACVLHAVQNAHSMQHTRIVYGLFPWKNVVFTYVHQKWHYVRKNCAHCMISI